MYNWDNLALYRKIIKQTLFGKFLNKKYLNYIEMYGANDYRTKQIADIWDLKYTKFKDDNGNIRNKLISELDVTCLVDETVIISNNSISRLLSYFSDSFFVTDKLVSNLIKSKFGDVLSDENSITINQITGSELEKTIFELKEKAPQAIIGIGGGRVMDYLKFIRMNTEIFTISIPTSLATHVYASPKIHSLPAIRELGYKSTIDGPLPDLSILDISFLSNLQHSNPRLIIAGLGDLMACTTAVYDWRLADKNKSTIFNESIAQMAEEIIDRLYQINVEERLENWIEDYSLTQVLLCNISDWAGSAPVSGSEHLFALSAESGIDPVPLHGELVALGCIIFSHIQDNNCEKVVDLVRRLQLPTSFKTLGVDFNHVVHSLVHTEKISRQKGRFTIVNILDIDLDYASKVVEDLLNKKYIEY